MLIGRMLIGRKLGLTLGFTVLLALAFGVSCTGFFPPNSLSAVSIQPPSPQIQAGSTNAQTLEAWGTYQDGTRSQITSGVEWTSSSTPPNVLTIGLTSGLATGAPPGGTATVTASAQGLSGTASATVYLGKACAGVAPRSRTAINVRDEEPDSRLHAVRIPLPF